MGFFLFITPFHVDPDTVWEQALKLHQNCLHSEGPAVSLQFQISNTEALTELWEQSIWKSLKYLLSYQELHFRNSPTVPSDSPFPLLLSSTLQGPQKKGTVAPRQPWASGADHRQMRPENISQQLHQNLTGFWRASRQVWSSSPCQLCQPDLSERHLPATRTASATSTA